MISWFLVPMYGQATGNKWELDQELRLILSRIEKVGRGIVLFHDTKAQTAQMLPAFLRELKERGYQIVHIIPAGGNAR